MLTALPHTDHCITRYPKPIIRSLSAYRCFLSLVSLIFGICIGLFSLPFHLICMAPAYPQHRVSPMTSCFPRFPQFFSRTFHTSLSTPHSSPPSQPPSLPSLLSPPLQLPLSIFSYHLLQPTATEDERDSWSTAIQQAKAQLLASLNVTHPHSTLASSSSTNHLRRSLQALPFLPEASPVSKKGKGRAETMKDLGQIQAPSKDWR
jgi:hypothetical protein